MSKIVVVGGTGVIGSQVVELLRAERADVTIASRATGVDLVSGHGLEAALRGAQVVIDVSKPRSTRPHDIDEFFSGAEEHLTRAEAAAGVVHHIMLSIVGVDRAAHVPFYAAKGRLENAIRAGGVPFTILRATQFFEFAPSIASVSTGSDGIIRLPPLLVQPLAGADVASALVRLTSEEPRMGGIELAGPERFELDDFICTALPDLSAKGLILRDRAAAYFGGSIDRHALVPSSGAQTTSTRLRDWLTRPR